MSDTLLISIVIGQTYQERYAHVFLENHKAYARQCGYDFIVATEFFDKKNQHSCFISLQKILVCSQEFSKNYKSVIYIDADILFNLKNASPLHLEQLCPDKITIANEYSQPNVSTRLEIQKLNGWEATASDYYALANLDIKTDEVLNTGVMIFNPEVHRPLLEKIYVEAISKGFNHPRGFHYEQAMIGYHLQMGNHYEVLKNSWNAIWMLQKLSPNNQMSLLDFYRSNKAVHFAGNLDIHLIPSLLAASRG